MRKLIVKFAMWLLDVATRTTKTGLVAHAEREIALIKKQVENGKIPEPDYYPFIFDAVINIVKAVAREHPSGGGLGLLMYYVKTLIGYDVLSPITGEDWEWNDVTEYDPEGGKLLQNNRNSAIFSNLGRSHYLDAFSTEDTFKISYIGDEFKILDNPYPACWNTSPYIVSEGIPTGYRLNRAFIKSFPFLPERFILKGCEVEIAKDDFMFFVDIKELDKLKEYYDVHFENAEKWGLSEREKEVLSTINFNKENDSKRVN